MEKKLVQISKSHIPQNSQFESSFCVCRVKAYYLHNAVVFFVGSEGILFLVTPIDIRTLDEFDS